jgi:hypothetical protein
MNLSWPLLTLSSHSEHRVLAVLAHAPDESLSAHRIARRAGTSPSGAMTALDRLVADGLVLRARGATSLLHALNHQHLAVGPLVALTAVSERLATRTGEHVAAWPQAPGCVALRLPCPEQVDARGGELVDVLVTAPADGQQPPARAGQALADFTDRLWRWASNEAHPHARADTDPLDADDEIVAAPWMLIAGQRPAGLPLADDATPASGDPGRGRVPTARLVIE